MEHLSIKLDPGLVKQINDALKDFNYSTKTEFIREAIRSKLKELNSERRKEQAWNKLLSMRGAFKDIVKPINDEEWLKLKHEAGEEYINMRKKELNQK